MAVLLLSEAYGLGVAVGPPGDVGGLEGRGGRPLASLRPV